MRKLLLIAALTLQACSTPPPPLPEEVSVKGYDDAPGFKRLYSVVLTPGFTMKIVSQDLYTGGPRWFRGEIDNANSQWAMFDASNLAASVFRTELGPLIKKYSAAIIIEDKAYLESKPSEFTDVNGVTWRRAP